MLAARGLPDFTALLEAELAAAEAAQEPGSGRRSSLGVGEVILSARELTGISQRALASKAGTSQAAVTAMETGNLPDDPNGHATRGGGRFELVIGLRKPGARGPVALGALIFDDDDALVDYVTLSAPSIYEGPPDR